MSKVLLVDTNFSSAPIYRALCDLGHEVHVVGGNPADCLAQQSSHYWQVNYADVGALQSLVNQQAFDYIVPGCTDRSYESCTLLSSNSKFGIDTVLTSQTINNKGLFKKWAIKANIPVAQEQEHQKNKLRWPLIVKPVDAFSGKGISILLEPNEEALFNAIELAKLASPSRDYLIEDYLEGQLYSHSAFLLGHKISQDFIVREDRTINPFVVDTSHVCFDFPDAVLAEIRSCIETISRDLNLVDGLIHTQFILRSNKFWLVEITRRCPGDLYSQLIELSTGFRYAQAYAMQFVGQAIDSSLQITKNFVMRHTMTVKAKSNFGHLHFRQPVLIDRFVSLCTVGQELKPSPASRIGIAFFKTSSHEELMKLYENTLSHQLYDVIS